MRPAAEVPAAEAAGFVLGVDIGTYEAKGVLVSADGSVIAQHRRPHSVLTPRPGFVEHDPETVWWGGFVEIAREVLEASGVDADDIRAIAVSGIGPCVLPVDADGSPLRNAILYAVDSRAQTQIDQLNEAHGEAEIVRRSGTPLSSQSAGPKILWIEQHEPEIFARAERFVTCQTFLVGRLTDRWCMDHATAAYFHPFYDRRTMDWNLDGAPSRLTRAQLPEPAWSSEIAGRIHADAAISTGLAVGTPVLTGAPDAVVEALSAGVAEPGDMMIMYGSSHFIIEVLDQQHSSDTLWPAPFLFPDSHLAAASLPTAGSFTRWFADLLDPAAGGTDSLYGALAEAAQSSPPGANGLVALPYLSGDAGTRGGFVGLTMQHTRGDMARAVAESIAHGVGRVLHRFDDDGLVPQRVRAVGGGTKNAAWLQAVSDVSGMTQEAVAGMGASYGDAMLAALAVGFIEDIASWVSVREVVEPRAELADLYARQGAAFAIFDGAAREIVALSAGDDRSAGDDFEEDTENG
ncbi:FGGY-family carbohydrate kinase [Microbacterium aerolatum]|uniref:FGGY-family carbohydrate kinase n=1 Tax=Microbacterium aerolatum TaxID=153731 RepID=UPI0038503340